jgi:hypothetical protein
MGEKFSSCVGKQDNKIPGISPYYWAKYHFKCRQSSEQAENTEKMAYLNK